MKLVFQSMPEHFGKGAIQAKVKCANGFKVSVISHSDSYGGQRGFYELGCFLPGRYRLRSIRRFLHGRFPYQEVTGWLSLCEAEQIADQVARLPRVSTLIKRHKAEIKAAIKEYRRAKRNYILGRGPRPVRSNVP